MDLRQQGCFWPREPVTGKRKSHACHLPERFSSSEVKRKKQSRGGCIDTRIEDELWNKRQVLFLFIIL